MLAILCVSLTGPYTAAAAGGGFNVSITEAATATDTVSATALLSVSLTEAGTASDTVSAIANFIASLTESGAATDVASATANFVSALTESASASDIDSAIANFISAISEAGVAIDLVSVSSGTHIFSDSITEIIFAIDAVDAFTAKSGFGPPPVIRLPLDRDDWGRFIPGSGYH